MRIPNTCLSVPREKNHPGFVDISPTLVIDTSMEGLHEYYSMETKIVEYFSKSSKLTFDLYFVLCWRAEITLASSMSAYTLVIDTSMERSSRVLQHGNLKM